MAYELLTTCVDCKDVDALQAAIDKAKAVTFSTFARHVNVQAIEKRLGYGRHLRLADDWAVRFFKSKWAGQNCYIMQWSAIEFIYCNRQQ